MYFGINSSSRGMQPEKRLQVVFFVSFSFLQMRNNLLRVDFFLFVNRFSTLLYKLFKSFFADVSVSHRILYSFYHPKFFSVGFYDNAGVFFSYSQSAQGFYYISVESYFSFYSYYANHLIFSAMRMRNRLFICF